ncbi:MAG: alpha/beta hydrolase, partial [Bullifex sp.]
VIGFSAGAHLVASLATMWDEEICADFDCRVSNVILGYPVITAGEAAHRGSIENVSRSGYPEEFWSLEKKVKPSTVPCFIFHSADDPTVPLENSLLYMAALKRAGVPFEAHIFPYGGHGYATATREVGSDFPRNTAWADMALDYLAANTGWRE